MPIGVNNLRKKNGRYAIEYDGHSIPGRFKQKRSAETWARWNYKGGDGWRVVDTTIEVSKTRHALLRCANWLAYCRSIGWPDCELDALEALWWRYHDGRGALLIG